MGQRGRLQVWEDLGARRRSKPPGHHRYPWLRARGRINTCPSRRNDEGRPVAQAGPRGTPAPDAGLRLHPGRRARCTKQPQSGEAGRAICHRSVEEGTGQAGKTRVPGGRRLRRGVGPAGHQERNPGQGAGECGPWHLHLPCRAPCGRPRALVVAAAGDTGQQEVGGRGREAGPLAPHGQPATGGW